MKEPDLSMTINCLMNEDISTADEGGDCVEDGEEAEDILPYCELTGKGSADNAKKLAKEFKGKGRFRRNEAFHKVQDNMIQMMLEVNANDQKGRMELAAFQTEAAATASEEEREAREARWKIEDERNSQARAMEIERMQAESARYSAEAALRNAEATTVADEHEMNITRRKREEEEAMEDKNIKRTNLIQARTMWLVEFVKKDAVPAVCRAYRKRLTFFSVQSHITPPFISVTAQPYVA